jgi:hypothetical protein
MTATEDLSLNTDFVPVDFSKVRVGAKSLTVAVLKLGDFKRANPTLADKNVVLKAIQSGDL